MKVRNLFVFYNGNSKFFKKEVELYHRFNEDLFVTFINIKKKDFNLEDWSLEDTEALDEKLHAMDGAGNVYVGIDAFIEIWGRLTFWWKVISKITKFYPIKMLAKFLYALFVKKN